MKLPRAMPFVILACRCHRARRYCAQASFSSSSWHTGVNKFFSYGGGQGIFSVHCSEQATTRIFFPGCVGKWACNVLPILGERCPAERSDVETMRTNELFMIIATIQKVAARRPMCHLGAQVSSGSARAHRRHSTRRLGAQASSRSSATVKAADCFYLSKHTSA